MEDVLDRCKSREDGFYSVIGIEESERYNSILKYVVENKVIWIFII